MEGGDSMHAALSHFAAEVFDELCVITPAVRAEVISMVIANGSIFTVTDAKYNLAALLSDLTDEPQENERGSVRIEVGLSPEEREMLTLANPDVELRFSDAATMPHGLAYAQRIVDTNRLLSHVPTTVTDVVDVGGNWTYYSPDRYFFSVHCCNLVDGWRELHRQTQRVVQVESGKPATDYCTDGVQNCSHIASWFVSVHTLPCIDPTLWPHIFREHMFEGGDAVFHFDPFMDTTATSGFIREAGMHWEDRGGVVEFHFEGDSSLPYSHSRQWLSYYARPQFITEDGWDKVIHYSITSIAGGCVTAHFELLNLAEVGVVPSQPIYRWTGDAGGMMVPVPRFTPATGLPMSDPMAYVTEYIRVPMALYEFVFFAGLANDTSRPDTPLSREEVLGKVRAYNYVLNVNSLQLTGAKLSAADVDDVATGIYLAVAYEAARSKVLLGAMTEQMLRAQKRWGVCGIMSLLTASVRYTALSPFMLLANTFQETVDLVTVYLRCVGADGLYASMPSRTLPYVSLGVTDPLNGMAAKFDPEVHDAPLSLNKEQREALYWACRSEMPDETRAALEAELFSGEPPEPPVERGLRTEVAGTAPDIQPAKASSVVPESDATDADEYELLDNTIEVSRDIWLRDFDRLRTRIPDWALTDEVEFEEAQADVVTRYAREAVLEYGLYQLDLEMNTKAQTLEHMRRHWVGSINERELKRDNITKEIDARFHKVESGYIVDMDDTNSRAKVVDVHTREFIDVVEKNGRFFVGETAIGVVYTTRALDILVGARLAARAFAAVKTGLRVSDVKFTVIDGIAGCGKTRAMTQNMTIHDAYVTGPKAPMRKELARAKADPRFEKYTKALDKRIRTADSAVCWGLPRSKVLYIDEGLMQHSGVMYLLAHLSGATEVVVSGDSKQIPFIDRGSGYGRLGFSTAKYWNKVTYMNESDRMPADVTYLCRKYFPEWRQPLIKTRSTIKRSMHLMHIPDVNSPLYSEPKPYEHWISVLQADKAAQTQKPGFEDGKVAVEKHHSDVYPVRPVLSTHEAQGDTYPVSSVFRYGKFSNAVFDSQPHQYVSISRHRLASFYKTVVGPSEDALARLYVEASTLTDEQLESVMAPSPDWLTTELEDMVARIMPNFI